MDYQLVALIVPQASDDLKESHAIRDRIAASALQVILLKHNEALERLKGLAGSGSGQEPAAIIIGPGIAHAVALARNIRAIWPTGQMLFMPGEELFNRVRQDLRHAPMIGSNWSLLELEDSAFVLKVQRAVSSSRQRIRLRTTLDKANISLAAAKPVDGLQYRRLVVSEHYLASLLQQSLDAIVSLDRHNAVLYWSAGAEALFGITSSAAQTRPITSMPFWSVSLEPGLTQIHGGSQSARIDLQCHLGGRETYLEVSFSRVHDETNAFIGTSLSLRDVSTQYQVLEAERAGRREAERISRLKDEFLALLSHELRTPLSAVIGRTQLLKMQNRNAPELLSALTVIERNAQLQAKLIEELLDVSSIMTGKLQLELQPIAIAKVIQVATESVKHLAENKKIWLIAPSFIRPATVHGDPFRMQQILFNLLTNAIKFTPEGGQIELEVSTNGHFVDITVRDNGCGISADFLPYVFEKFGQEDASITRRHGGLGLGLSIVKQLVELHGGAICALSGGRDLGACFTISLPVLAGDAMRADASSKDDDRIEEDSDALRGCRVLVVEDVADARALVVDVLHAHGAEVIAVDSAAAALRALDTALPEILVSDIGMAEMDGYELIRKIRARGITNEQLPAIALTAFASAADRSRAIQAGFQSHVAKPLIVTELVHHIVCEINRVKG